MILFPWVGYALLKCRAAEYLADRANFEEERKRLLTLRSRRRVPERDETFTSLWDLMIRKGRHRLLLGQVCAFHKSPRRGLDASPDAAGFVFVKIASQPRHQPIGPLLGVSHRGLELEPQPLAGSVQPAA